MRTRPAQLRPPQHQQPPPAAAAKKVRIAAAHRIPDAAPFPARPRAQSESPPTRAAVATVPEPPQSADVPSPDPPDPHPYWEARRSGEIQAPAPLPPA